MLRRGGSSVEVGEGGALLADGTGDFDVDCAAGATLYVAEFWRV